MKNPCNMVQQVFTVENEHLSFINQYPAGTQLPIVAAGSQGFGHGSELTDQKILRKRARTPITYHITNASCCLQTCLETNNSESADSYIPTTISSFLLFCIKGEEESRFHDFNESIYPEIKSFWGIPSKLFRLKVLGSQPTPNTPGSLPETPANLVPLRPG